MKRSALIVVFAGICSWAQEATTGFELRATVTLAGMASSRLTQSPREGSAVTAGARAVLYPTWKLSKNWTVAGAVQLQTQPYFVEQFGTQGYGARADILQAHVSYSRFWSNKSVAIRVGQLSSAFGSFLLRYDDAANPLVDMPPAYGYYYKPVSTYDQAGVQADVTIGRFDVRAQFANSSPANRRSVFDKDQYGNWTGGVGYTIVQGLRVGGSAYHGPYLHREHPYFRKNEVRPKDLPASGLGLDLQWARGHWNAHGEWHWFTRAYRVMPTLTQQARYGEFRRVLHPRWYVAGRFGSMRSSVSDQATTYEGAVGFRPSAYQLVKVGYQYAGGAAAKGHPNNSIVFQVVTSFRALSIARD